MTLIDQARTPFASEVSTFDLVGAQQGAARMLAALGVAIDTESTRDTPARMVKALAELLTPTPFSLTTFPNDEEYGELLVQSGIPLVSLCEHHGLPFLGRAVVGYLPGKRIVGLSKLTRVVRHFARRPQVQERLTKQIAASLHDRLEAEGVGVVIHAEHLCMTLRGVQAPGTMTVTTSFTGALLGEDRTRNEFFLLAGQGREGR
jgi:GTP cyclohydrolase I